MVALSLDIILVILNCSFTRDNLITHDSMLVFYVAKILFDMLDKRKVLLTSIKSVS